MELIDSHTSFCGRTYNLDHEQIEIFCKLLRNFQGWSEPGPTGGNQPTALSTEPRSLEIPSTAH